MTSTLPDNLATEKLVKFLEVSTKDKHLQDEQAQVLQSDNSRTASIHPDENALFRLVDIHSANSVGEFHFPPALLDFSPALVVTDVDSTLILEEVIDQLAAEAGVESQVSQITAAAMRGEIDFTQSLHARVKTLAGLDEDAFERVFKRLHVTPGAKALVDWVHECGGRFAVVSGGFTQIVQPLAKSLGIDYTLAIELEVKDGYLTGEVASPVVTAESKVQALKTWAREMDTVLALPAGSSLERTVAVGDGANDIPMLQTAALGIAFCAKPKVQESIPSKLNLRCLDAVSWTLEQIRNHT